MNFLTSIARLLTGLTSKPPTYSKINSGEDFGSDLDIGLEQDRTLASRPVQERSRTGHRRVYALGGIALVVLIISIATARSLSCCDDTRRLPKFLEGYVPNLDSGAIIGTTETENIRVEARPANVKIVGLVFFGRRQFVDILDCCKRWLIRDAYALTD